MGEPLIKDPDCYDHAHHQFKQFVGQHLEEPRWSRVSSIMVPEVPRI